MGSHRSPLGPQKSQIKLTIASFLSPNQMEHTVFILMNVKPQNSNIFLLHKSERWSFSRNKINAWCIKIKVHQQFKTFNLEISINVSQYNKDYFFRHQLAMGYINWVKIDLYLLTPLLWCILIFGSRSLRKGVTICFCPSLCVFFYFIIILLLYLYPSGKRQDLQLFFHTQAS